MSGAEPEMWVGDPVVAIDFYARALNATVLHRVGFDNEVVARLAIGNARCWVSNTGHRRFDPRVIGGTTSRTLLVPQNQASSLRSQSRPALNQSLT